MEELYCPSCQNPNPHNNIYCQQCRTPLPKRYLWAVGAGIESHKYYDGDTHLLAKRYLRISDQIVLDTKPGLPPETTEDIPPAIAPYLKLFPYRLHIPQVYGLVPNRDIWLLEEVPIYSGGISNEISGQIMPELANAWRNALAITQLNWLWQIAQLWEPMQNNGVASSLLNPALLRVEGSLVKLLQLQNDRANAPTLQELGRLWLQWVPQAQSTVRNFLEQLCQRMIQGQVQRPDQLIELINEGIVNIRRSQTRTYNIVTYTDKGPSRKRNEDSCYPAPNSSVSSEGLAIVCDGIGGHEGGDVASNLAIQTIVEQIKSFSNLSQSNTTKLTEQLETAVCAANDRISQRNDTEQRQDRQRMGTTLVMTLANAHQIYITHVGDSRVYRITRNGCHQITLDDDIASREVRLGYALYRDAVQQPTSGSLVQALGMSSSATLHPTVQSMIVDEDCIFLLCSDGLSDNDRVDQYWETEILPVLKNEKTLAAAGQSLIEIANTKNGHDNVTVALVHCQVSNDVSASQISAASLPQMKSSASPATVIPPKTTTIQTKNVQPSPPVNKMRSPWLIGGLIVFIGLLAGGLTYLLKPKFLAEFQSPLSSPSPTPTASTSFAISLEPDRQIKIPQEIKLRRIQPTTASQTPQQPNSLIVPAGSIWQVVAKKPVENQDNLLDLKVCSNIQTEKSTNPQPNAAKTPTNSGQKKGNVSAPVVKSSTLPTQLLILESEFKKIPLEESTTAESCKTATSANPTPIPLTVTKPTWEIETPQPAPTPAQIEDRTETNPSTQ